LSEKFTSTLKELKGGVPLGPGPYFVSIIYKRSPYEHTEREDTLFADDTNIQMEATRACTLNDNRNYATIIKLVLPKQTSDKLRKNHCYVIPYLAKQKQPNTRNIIAKYDYQIYT
jgi:hypothetical protein